MYGGNNQMNTNIDKVLELDGLVHNSKLCDACKKGFSLLKLAKVTSNFYYSIEYLTFVPIDTTKTDFHLIWKKNKS